MAMNRDKFRNIVGGITSPEAKPQPAQAVQSESTTPPARAKTLAPPEAEPAGQGPEASESSTPVATNVPGETRRFAKRGRPKGGKQPGQAGTVRKVKISLFLSEIIVNDLYEWAHDDRMHPGEMFDLALKSFHEREAKRRKAGKE